MFTSRHLISNRFILILLGCLLVFSSFAPSNVEKRKKAQDLHSNDELEAALKVYNEILLINKENTELLCERGNLLLQMHESEKALMDFKKILSFEKENFLGNLGMAKYHAMKYQIVPSLGYLEKACENLRIEDDKFNLLRTKGEILMLFNMYAEAEIALFEAISIKPDDYYLIELFAQSLQRQGKNNELLEFLYIVSNENEMTPNTLTKMGYLMNNIHQFGEANLYLEQALNMNPNHSGAHCHMAYTYMKLQKFKDALKKIDRSISLDPLNPYSYRVRGEILGHLDKNARGCKDFTRAISLEYIEQYGEDILVISKKMCQGL